jgi:large subunit ribosomal protein L3
MELLGRKIGMTQVFDAHGNFVGATVVEVGPCVVLQKKTAATKDKYNAVQLGFGERKAKNAGKPLIGHCKKANSAPAAFVREVRLGTEPSWNVGDKVTVKEFKPGEFVDVIGTTKGKGFQGVVFRHKFAGGPMTHGNKGWKRRSGAIGERLTPGRVFRGQRMPGHMGAKNVTTQNLRVVQVREGDNILLIEGAIPGAKGAYVVVRHAKKKGVATAAKAA